MGMEGGTMGPKVALATTTAPAKPRL